MWRTLRCFRTRSTQATSTKKAKSVPTGCRAGQTRRSMRVNGPTIKQTARDSSGVPMEIHTRATGRMIKLMDSELLSLKMARNSTSASGKTIYTMVKASRAGQTALGLMAISHMVRKTASVPTSGQTRLSTQAIGLTTRCRVKALISGWMDANLTEIGTPAI